MGRSAHELLRTEYPAPPAEVQAALIHRGEWAGDLRQRSRNGRELTVAARKVLRRDGRGKPLAVFEALVDVTEQRRAERALREGEAMLDAVPVGMIITSLQGGVVRDNAAHRELWGGTPETPQWHQYGEWVGYWPDGKAGGDRAQRHARHPGLTVGGVLPGGAPALASGPGRHVRAA